MDLPAQLAILSDLEGTVVDSTDSVIPAFRSRAALRGLPEVSTASQVRRSGYPDSLTADQAHIEHRVRGTAVLRRIALVITTAVVLGAGSATAQAASIWTPLNSGTAATITSIVYQSPTRFWYATSAGTVAYFNGAGFTNATGIEAGEEIVDMAFQPVSKPGGPGTVGLVGFAVTHNGHVWRSTDGGVNWSKIGSPTTRTECSVASTPVAETELNAVQWAGESDVFLLGDNSTILRSTNAGATFTEINKNSVTCAMQGEASAQDMTDASFLPANPDHAVFVARNFGRLYASDDAVAEGSPSGSLVNSDTVNSFNGTPRIAQDPLSPNRIWVVGNTVDGFGCGTLCLERSTDGGTFAAAASFPNDAAVKGDLYDISSQGGAEVTAGSGGEIFTSVDGTNFYDQPAEGALATENWRAEAAYDAQHAAVGGESGALAITAAANTIPTPPSTPPPGPIASTAPPATAGGAPPPGPPTGSNAVKANLGGATATIYKVVTVTGRSARFVPVVVATSKPRKFVAKILPLKGHRVLATGRLTIKRRHGGHGTIDIQLPASVKPGTYLVVVRETTLAGKALGRVVKVRFSLK